jgi:thioredoxin
MGGKILQATLGNLPELLRSGKPVVVDFWAGWCAPCRVMAPIMKSLAKEFDQQIAFAKVDVPNNRDLAEQFKIRNLPTVILFKNGKEWDRFSGLKGRSDIRNLLRKISD